VDQSPSPTHATIKPAWLETRLCEEVPRGSRVNEGQILEQDAFPEVVDVSHGLCAAVGEVRVPFLADESLGANQGGAGDDGEHVDALDGVEVAVEKGGVVAFVLEELG
jgi:hypothetical protein